MIDRRRFVSTLLGAITVTRARTALAQSPAVPRVGLIAPTAPLVQAFKEGLRDAGYVDGQDIRVERRSVRDPGET